MTKHWIRDMPIPVGAGGGGEWNSGLGKVSYLLFHFLRNAGWEWLWECDGYPGDAPNRVTDGNMEAAGTAEWTGVGSGLVSKVTTPVHSGFQALKVQSQFSGDGVIMTNALTSMVPDLYLIAIWALNNTGQPWTIWDGAVLLGSIPSGPSYTLTKIEKKALVVGSKLKILDSNGTLGTIYVSDVLVVKSYFEHIAADDWEGTHDGDTPDGATINPDQFSSGSYSFVLADVGKVICIWDPTPGRNKNSGAYKILSVAGGVATLDMRSPSATFIASSGLRWRMIDLSKAPDNDSNTDEGARRAGFGLQSPHTSKWRLFIRQIENGGTTHSQTGVWGAPSDTDFDFSTGTFYRTGPSTQNDKQVAYYYEVVSSNWDGMHFWTYDGSAGQVGNRMYLMTDESGSFFSMFLRDGNATQNCNDCPTIGYLGSSLYLPGEEAWGLFARWEKYIWSAPVDSGVNFASDGGCDFRYGTMIGSDGKTKNACWGQLGYGSSTADVNTMSNASDNPWSGREWMHKPIIIRDPDDLAFDPGEMEADIGIYLGRTNMPAYSTFDSNSYLHFRNGFIWEWMGESVIP